MKYGALIHEQTFAVEIKNRNYATANTMYKKGIKAKFERHLSQFARKPFDRPVKLIVTRILGIGQRVYDYDSIGRGDAKELIDTLSDIGWFNNDGPRWIQGVFYDQDKSQRWSGPAVKVQVFEVE